jgi:Prophage tail length tape measure protein
MGKQIQRYEHQLGANHTQYDNAMRRSAKNTKGFSDSQRSLAASISLVDGPLGGVASRVSNMNTLLSSGGLALGAAALGVASLGFAAAKAVSKLSEFEVSQQRINNLLKQTGFAAGRTASQLEELAQAEGFRTLADVSDIRSASAVLTSYGSVVGDVFDRTIKLGNDAAQVYGGDVTSSVKTLAIALDNPAKGLERLERKYGNFDDTVKDNIISLAEQGRLFEAQDKILASLEKRLSGAGAGEGIAFSIDTLGQSVSNALVSGGDKGGLSGLITSVSDAMSGFFQGFDKIVRDPTFADLEEEIAKREKIISDFSSFIEKENRSLTNYSQGNIATFRAKLELQKQELEELKKIAAPEKARREELEKTAVAARDKAAAARKEREEWEALSAMAQTVDDFAEEYNKKQEVARKKRVREQEVERKRLASLTKSNEATISSIRIASLDGIEKLNAEHEQTIQRLERIKELTPSLASDVDNVIPIAQARNIQDQKDVFARQLDTELSGSNPLEIEEYGPDSGAELQEQYEARKLLIQSFAEDEILAAEAKNEALNALDREYADQAALLDKWRWENAEATMMSALGNLSSLMNSNSKKAFQIGKIAAIAETVINTYKSATAAYAAMAGIPVVGPSLGVAAAAAAVAAGLVNVQAINSRSYGDTSAPTVASSPTAISSSATPSYSEVTDSRAGVEIVLNGNYNGDPELLANAIKEVIDDTDFVLVDPASRNGQELAA